MNYCTIDDIIMDVSESTLIEISNDSDSPVMINSELVDAKIAEVSSYIDRNISSRYTVPITNTDDIAVLKPFCVSLVVCDLYQRRLGLDFPESLGTRRKLALSEIGKIRDGMIKLTEVIPDSKPGVYRVSKRSKMFTNELMDMYNQ